MNKNLQAECAEKKQALLPQLPDPFLKEDDQINLQKYGYIIWHHRLSIVGLALLAGLLAALVVFSMTPVYKSTASLLIELKSNNVVSIADVYGVTDRKQFYATQAEILRSRLLAEKVIDRLKLNEESEFQKKVKKPLFAFDFDWRSMIKDWLPKGKEKKSKLIDEEEQERDRLVKRYLANLQITPIKRSQLVKITFQANDRHLAAKIANAHAELYIESDMDARLQMTSKATSWLTGRLEGLRKTLQKSEKELQDYREAQQLVEVGGVTTLAAQNLQELGQNLVVAQQKQSRAAEALKQIKSVKNASIEQLESIPAVLDDGLIVSLMQAEATAKRAVSTLKKRYGPLHPKMIHAQADLKEAKMSIRKRVTDVLNGVEKEYESAKAGTRSIEKLMTKAKGEAQSINRMSYQLSVLEQEVESNRNIYDIFLGRMKETNETVGLEKTYARVADPAVASIKPAKPKKRLIVLIATVVGGILGMLLAFLRNHLDNTVKDSADLEQLLGVPVLGILPFLKLKQRETPVSYARLNPKSFFSESIRTIRTGILLSSLDDPHKIIVVTSSVPGEGKSTVSMSLAESLGELHNVLLLDADMRRPTVATSWGLKKGVLGLSEYVSGTAKISECIHSIDDSAVKVMPSGVVPPNPLELLSSNRFEQVLNELAKSYDHIIIDSAPSLAVSDSLVLSTHASGVIFVTMGDSTSVPTVREGLKRLVHARAHIIGSVLNGVVRGKKGSYGYSKYNGYRSGYYNSYGYSTDR